MSQNESALDQKLGDVTGKRKGPEYSPTHLPTPEIAKTPTHADTKRQASLQVPPRRLYMLTIAGAVAGVSGKAPELPLSPLVVRELAQELVGLCVCERAIAAAAG